MAYDVTYNADFNILATITAPLEFRTDNLICSNCGETFCANPDGINAPIDWTYCPNCGYRIAETNSGEDNNGKR